MKTLLYATFGIAVMLFGVTFAIKNSQIVEINYYFGLSVTSSLSWVLLSTLGLGVVVGFVASLVMVVRVQRQYSQSRRDIRKMEQEVTNLRALPIKDAL